MTFDLPANSHGAAPWPPEWFEHAAACLFCGSTCAERFLDGVQDWFFGAVPGSFAFSRCSACQSLLLEQRPDAAHIGAAYQGYYTHAIAAPPPDRASWKQQLIRALGQGYARCRYHDAAGLSDRLLAMVFGLFPLRRSETDAAYRYLPRVPARVLDFGCGNGAFLSRAIASGHQASGIDLDAAAVAVARQRGLEVWQAGEFAKHRLDAQFDHITAVHVLEHVPDPPALLADFRRWLKPGGSLFIEVPNAQAGGLARHGRFWRGLEAPRHFAVPSEAGLREALERAGFAVARFGGRAFAASFTDVESDAAAAAHPDIAAGQGPDGAATGPEFLTCLAYAR